MRLIFYAAVTDRSMLEQGFYKDEILGLKSRDEVSAVTATNRWTDLLKDNFDAAIGYFYSYSALAALICLCRGKPIVLTGGAEQLFREFAPSRSAYLARFLAFNLCVAFSSKILAVSSTDFRQMMKIAIWGRTKIELSFHSAPSVICASAQLLSNSRTNSSMLTICGMDSRNNIERKGLLRAIDLLGQMAAQDENARLTVVGRTTLVSWVTKYAKTIGVAERITYTGYITEQEKQDLLKSHKYYVQLSTYEGFGIGALEALAMGCVIIHSNVGGLRDTVGDFGIKLGVQDVHTFDITALDQDPRPEWGRLGKHLEQFSPELRASKLLNALG